MNCNKVAKALSEDSQLSSQAQEHVRSCDRCRKLVSALNMSGALDDPPSPAILRRLTENIATNLRPVQPLAPAAYFFAVFVCVFVSIVAIGVYRVGAFGIAAMNPLQTTTILIALAISAVLLVQSLIHQMVPGGRHRFPPKLLPLGIAICLTIGTAILFRFKHEHHFWARNWSCAKTGILIGVLAAVPFWLMLRRGSVLSPSITGTSTGLLAGLVGTSVLEIHCPNLDAWHILVSHVGVAILCALAGLVFGLTAETVSGRSVHRSNEDHRAPLVSF